MAARPGEPLGAGAFGEGFAVHAPAQVGAFGGKAHALAVGGLSGSRAMIVPLVGLVIRGERSCDVFKRCFMPLALEP